MLLLTLNPIAAQTNQPRQEARTSGAVPVVAPSSHTGRTPNRRLAQNLLIRAWCSAYAIKHGIEPAAAMAVARIESGKADQEFRTGRMGKTYYGPMGIHKCFLKRWSIDQTEKNIEVGVKALARHKDLRSALKKFNNSFDEKYWRAVVQARNHYRKKGVSDD